MPPSRNILLPALLLLFLPACSDSSTGSRSGERLFADLTCSIPENDILDGGVGIDGIPSVQNPTMVSPTAPGAAYLDRSDRIIGLVLDGQPVAIPHNILWWHEIANLDLDSGERLAVTYCPLTGTSMVFDRAPVDGATLGVSGLLFRSNLIMYDRQSGQSLWPQMLRGARCGPADGTALPMVASLEMTWEGWQALHPATQVVSSELGFARNYRLYPYGDYERPTNAQTLVPLGGLDERRPPKERVLGIPTFGGGGIAFPFFELNALGVRGVVHPERAPDQVVVFWDREVEGAMAYRPTLDGEPVVFQVVDGRIVDQGSGSQWRIDGVAVEGPLAGRALEPINDAYVAFWFAWADFHPETELWLP